MQYKREDRVKVQLTVHRPISGYPGGPGDYYVAVTGSGLQLGNNDPDKAPRCQPIGHDLWVKDIWPLKNSDIKFKFLVIRRGNNAIVDVEHIGPHNLSVDNRPIIVDATYNRPRISATEVEERPSCGPKYCRKIDRNVPKPLKNTVHLKDHLAHRDQPKYSLSAHTKKVLPRQMTHTRNTPNAPALPQLQNECHNTGGNKQDDVQKNVTQAYDNAKVLLKEEKLSSAQTDDNRKEPLSPPALTSDDFLTKEVTRKEVTTIVSADYTIPKASLMQTDNTLKSEPESSTAEKEDVPKNTTQADDNAKVLPKEEKLLKSIVKADDNSKELLSLPALVIDDSLTQEVTRKEVTPTITADYTIPEASEMQTDNTIISEPESSTAENEELESLVLEEVEEVKGPLETDGTQSANTRCYPCTGKKVLLGVAGVAALFGVGYYAFCRK